MSADQLELVLSYVGPMITKQTRIRDPIEPKQKLVICIRFMATGESFRSLAMQYRVGKTTVATIVPEVCTAIWASMDRIYLVMPTTSEEWKRIAMNFQERWDYPNCIGAIDGKHIVINSPASTGSLYYNYKGTFSMVLMALVDAQNAFIYVDIGSYGRQSDAGIFANCSIGQKLLQPNTLNLPQSETISGAEYLGPLPYVIVGDEAFPLQKHVMRPYPGRQLTQNQDAFNYRLSRARRIVECAFGILASQWRVFYSRLAVAPEHVSKIIQAAIILHNMLQRETAGAIRNHLEDNIPQQVEGMQGLRRLGTRGTNEAQEIRALFTRYFADHPLPWQTTYIQRGLHGAQE